jgi:hypothetical protein
MLPTYLTALSLGLASSLTCTRCGEAAACKHSLEMESLEAPSKPRKSCFMFVSYRGLRLGHELLGGNLEYPASGLEVVPEV